MSKHLIRDLEELKRELLTMGGLVEDAINKAVRACLGLRAPLADEVLAGDNKIDAQENRVEDMALKALALHQPVAADLRFVVMVLKVNHDLERMGDLAVTMAERTVQLVQQPPLDVSLPLEAMSEIVLDMVRRALDALIDRDASQAREVLREDVRVDELHRQMYAVLQDQMRKAPDTVERAVHNLSISRCLERLADHATNIAEDVVFMVEGETIRHRKKLTLLQKATDLRPQEP